MATRQRPPGSYPTGSAGSRISAMRVRLAIGDFSRMTHLSVVTLRHYHEVGLLIPAEIDPQSGYRFYEPGQVRIAQVIRRFRDLGMPLDQIREVLQAPDTPARNQVIAAHLQRMEDQLALTQSVVASLRSLLERPPPPVAVEHRSVAPAYGLGIREQVPAPDLDAWWEAAFRELDAALAAASVRPAGPRAALYPAEFFELGAGEVAAYVPVAAPVPAAGRVSMFQIPAAELAVAVHTGTPGRRGPDLRRAGHLRGRARNRRRRADPRAVPGHPVRYRGRVGPGDRGVLAGPRRGDAGPRLDPVEEGLDLGAGERGAVAGVDDQAAHGDVLGRVEGDEPAVGLLLALDVGGPGLGVDPGTEPDPGGGPAGDHGLHHFLQLADGAGRQRGGGELLGPG